MKDLFGYPVREGVPLKVGGNDVGGINLRFDALRRYALKVTVEPDESPYVIKMSYETEVGMRRLTGEELEILQRFKEGNAIPEGPDSELTKYEIEGVIRRAVRASETIHFCISEKIHGRVGTMVACVYCGRKMPEPIRPPDHVSFKCSDVPLKPKPLEDDTFTAGDVIECQGDDRTRWTISGWIDRNMGEGRVRYIVFDSKPTSTPFEGQTTASIEKESLIEAIDNGTVKYLRHVWRPVDDDGVPIPEMVAKKEQAAVEEAARQMAVDLPKGLVTEEECERRVSKEREELVEDSSFLLAKAARAAKYILVANGFKMTGPRSAENPIGVWEAPEDRRDEVLTEEECERRIIEKVRTMREAASSLLSAHGFRNAGPSSVTNPIGTWEAPKPNHAVEKACALRVRLIENDCEMAIEDMRTVAMALLEGHGFALLREVSENAPLGIWEAPVNREAKMLEWLDGCCDMVIETFSGGVIFWHGLNRGNVPITKGAKGKTVREAIERAMNGIEDPVTEDEKTMECIEDPVHEDAVLLDWIIDNSADVATRPDGVTVYWAGVRGATTRDTATADTLKEAICTARNCQKAAQEHGITGSISARRRKSDTAPTTNAKQEGDQRMDEAKDVPVEVIALGDTVIDLLTKFEGVAIARVARLGGDVQVEVQALGMEGGVPVSAWIDEKRLRSSTPC